MTRKIFDPIRKRLLKHISKFRASKTGYLGYAFLDIVVDNYLCIRSDLGEGTGDLRTDTKKFKKGLNISRKIIKPIRGLMVTLLIVDSNLVSVDCYIYFKQLLSNITRASDVRDSYRDIL